MLRLSLLLFLNVPLLASSDSAVLVLRKMHETYAGKWYKTLRFTQETNMYMNDSLTKSERWIESIEFPDKFRIDFNAADGEDLVIFRNDSVYRMKDGKAKQAYGHNFLLFQLGGMYFYPFDTVKARFAREGYDLSRFRSDALGGRPVYVIGAEGGDDSSKQVWIDKEHLYIVRTLEYGPKGKDEARFEKHVRLNGGWCETKITFWSGRHFRQEEFYLECLAGEPFDPRLFDPKRWKEWHWATTPKKKNERKRSKSR